jgi:hypothetical protein
MWVSMRTEGVAFDSFCWIYYFTPELCILHFLAAPRLYAYRTNTTDSALTFDFGSSIQLDIKSLRSFHDQTIDWKMLGFRKVMSSYKNDTASEPVGVVQNQKWDFVLIHSDALKQIHDSTYIRVYTFCHKIKKTFLPYRQQYYPFSFRRRTEIVAHFMAFSILKKMPHLDLWLWHHRS